MNTGAIILAVIDILLCIALVAFVIAQEGNSQGLGSLAGNSESFFGQNQSRSKDVILRKVTTFIAVVFVVITMILFRMLL